MSNTVDLRDVQGLAVKAYAKFGYPKARFVFFRIARDTEGREFIRKLVPLVTTGEPWKRGVAPPAATTDIALTYEGLKRLGVPEMSLHGFPDEFSMGMRARRDILDDRGPSDPENWDPIWNRDEEQSVHVMVALNGFGNQPEVAQRNLDERYSQLAEIYASVSGGVQMLSGHRGPGGEELPYQDASALLENGRFVPKEHFGYTDGISLTCFKGSGSTDEDVIGGGKPTGGDPRTAAGWAPLETGEFLLGYKDEASELPDAPLPVSLSKNGTYLVYRKLHQNVATFRRFVDEVGRRYPGGAEELSAKFVGRWKNGAPLVSFPTRETAEKFGAELDAAQAAAYRPGATDAERARFQQLAIQLRAFNYEQDLDGVRCPTGAHIRRANPRGALEFGQKGAFDVPGALDNRRRIARRGLPYGQVTDPTSDDGDHGIVFMVVNASIKRQFEFVQQQWVAYGNDFKLANDKDPVIGNHATGGGRFVVNAQPGAGKPPFLVNKVPTFVTTRGGDYFFLPSLTALNLIAEGLVDPT